TQRDIYNVTILNGTTNQIIGMIRTPFSSSRANGPIGITYDNRNNELYIANAWDDVVEVFPQVYPVTFRETGLPTNEGWNVTLGREEETSRTSSAMAFVPNGTYDFRVGGAHGYQVMPTTGQVVVNGLGVSQPLEFEANYSISVIERGLPTGTRWWVDYDAMMVNSTSKNALLNLTNGSYYLHIQAAGGWVSSPSQIPIVVEGGGFGLIVNFTRSQGSGQGWPGITWLGWTTTLLAAGGAMAVATVHFVGTRRKRR
ncbi:thermopsin precursor, partial [mine drainage metagenome]